MRQRARQAMRTSTNGLQLMLGIAASPIATPTHLRFCTDCRLEMTTQVGETWWRRSHQLPGVLMCPDHGCLLVDSP
ncbi:TniQ family protein, partial [Acinetobacter baumannii]